MSIATSPAVVESQVTLLHFGEGVQRFDLQPGATLADLLRESGADPAGKQVMIDGRPIEEAVILRPGMIVSLSPMPAPAPDPEPWRSTVGMFKDDPGFEQMMEDVMAARAAEKCEG
jgi:hypothetical protein